MKKRIKTLTIAGLLVAASIGGYSIYKDVAVYASASSVSQSEGKLIREKMLNAVDNYNNATGSFVYTSSRGDTQYIDFEVSEGTDPSSTVIVKDKEGKTITQISNKTDSIVATNETEKSFTKTKKVKWEIPKEKSRKGKHEDGSNTYVYRQDPASAGPATTVTFPQEVAFWLDDEEMNYSVKGHETILGRDATIISGNMIKSLKPKAEKFTMYVDTATGILLGLETTRLDGTSAMGLKVNTIQIDTTANKKALLSGINLNGYTEKKTEDIKQKVEEEAAKQK